MTRAAPPMLPATTATLSCGAREELDCIAHEQLTDCDVGVAVGSVSFIASLAVSRALSSITISPALSANVPRTGGARSGESAG